MAVREVCEANEEIKKSIIIEFVGEVHPSFKEFVTSDATLASITKFTSTVPHRELMNIYSTSAVLVLILIGYKDAEGYMPGKLFEYLATGIPILGVGPTEGDASTLIEETQSGSMMDENDLEGIKNTIKNCFEEWRNNKPVINARYSKKYSRKIITEYLVNYLQ